MNLIANELFLRNWTVSLAAINEGPKDSVVLNCENVCLKRPWKAGFIDTLRAFKILSRFVKDWAPDLMILNCSLPELFGAFLLGKHRLVVVEHAPIPWGNWKILGLVVRKILKFRKATWVAVSPHLQIWPGRNVPSRVIQNPIANQSSANQKIPDVRRVKRLVYIGRLSEEKQPDVFLNLIENLKMPGLVIGDGYLRSALEEREILQSLDVTFLGHVRDPWEYLREGDLLVVPSAWEGDGIVVLEAVSRFVPILVSDISSFRSFGLNEINYCKQSEDFELAIQENLNHLERFRLSSNCAIEVLESRSIDVVASKWESLFLAF